jgi:tetratricopeptide (TPR) repeat protein
VDALERAVTESGTAVLGQVLAGTGGVGKTQLAAHYARHSWRAGAVELLVWISAATREAVVSTYAQAGIDVADADPAEPEQAAARFLSWLETTNRRWLVVLDDLADPSDLRGLWPPRNQTGQVVITTRRRDAALTGEGRRLVEVDIFTPAEAVAYVTARLNAHGRDAGEQILGLAQDLGCLPLALAQAVTYLLDLGLDVVSYRGRLADRRRTLADLVPDESGLPDDHRVTLAATWSLSVEHADRLRPEGLARPMLELASMLDPNGIPGTVLTSLPARAYLALYRTPRTTRKIQPNIEQTVSPSEATDALRSLYRLSLIEHSLETPHRTVRIHKLIQRSTRELLSNDHHRDLALAAAVTLHAAWPEVERDTTLAQILRANADALADNAGTHLWQNNAHRILFRSGKSLGEVGLVTDAVRYWQYLSAAAQAHLGPDHIDTLAARHHLASWRGEAGDRAGALSDFEQLLEDRLRVFGPDHPGNLAARHNLAYLRGQAGDAAGAASAFEQLLEDELRVLGPDHPTILTTRSNLARWRGQAGDAAGAASAYEQLLEDELRVLGPDHPTTLTSRHNLAYFRGRAGDLVGAASAFEQLLEHRLRIFGPDDPGTLDTRYNLAQVLGEAGDAAGAASAYEQLLEDRLRVLGPDHPTTLSTRSNLAYFRGRAGDLAGAISAFEQLLEDRLRSFGPNHPDTLIVRNNLASCRGQSGDLSGAVSAFDQLLKDELRVLGPDHPNTLTTRHNLAYWLDRSRRSGSG